MGKSAAEGRPVPRDADRNDHAANDRIVIRDGCAARTVAAHSADLEECRELLAMLGLHARQHRC